MDDNILSNAEQLGAISTGEAIGLIALTLLAATMVYGLLWSIGKGLHFFHERYPHIIPDTPFWLQGL